jgi:hypothetical protein
MMLWLCMALLSSFHINLNSNNNTDRNNSIKGNGNIQTISVNQSDWSFSEIISNTFCDVEIYPSAKTQVIISGDDNLLELIDIQNKDNQLSINKKEATLFSSIQSGQLKVQVHTPLLHNIQLYGSGNINTQGDFTSNDLITINNSGAGNINLNISSTSFDIQQSGAGNIFIQGLASSIKVKQSGAGNINLSKLQAQSAILKISGAGNTDANISDTVDAKISGVGNIQLHITPKTLYKNISGVGSINIL